jgi:hypothetical protein
MKKSVFGLVFASATLAGAMGSASPAGAVIYDYNGSSYDVTTHVGSFNALQSTLQSTNNKLWGDALLSSDLANLVGLDLGLPNSELGPPAQEWPGHAGQFGPYFAYSNENFGGDDLVWMIGVNEQGFSVSGNFGVLATDVRTFATATAVPWDISGSATIIGSITGIGLGVGLKRLTSKKNINIKE